MMFAKCGFPSASTSIHAWSPHRLPSVLFGHLRSLAALRQVSHGVVVDTGTRIACSWSLKVRKTMAQNL